MPGKESGNPAAGMAISIGIMTARHSLVCELVVEKPLCLFHNSVRVCAHEQGRARGHRLRALGLIPQHQHGLSQGRCFLLNPPRIRHQEMCPAHQIDKRNVVQGIEERYV